MPRLLPVLLAGAAGLLAASEPPAAARDLLARLHAAMNTEDRFAITRLLDQDALGARLDALGTQTGLAGGAHRLRRQGRLIVQAHLHGQALGHDWSASRIAAWRPLPDGGELAVEADLDGGGSTLLVLRCVQAGDALAVSDLLEPLTGVWRSTDAALRALDDAGPATAAWLDAARAIPDLFERACDAATAREAADRLVALDRAGLPEAARRMVEVALMIAAWRLEDDAGAGRLAAAVLADQGDHPTALWLQGQLAHRAGRHDDGLAAARRFRALYGAEPENDAVLLWALARPGREAELAAYCRTVLDRDPQDHGAFQHLLPAMTDDEAVRRLLAAAGESRERLWWILLRAEDRPDLPRRAAEAWAGAAATALPPRLWLAERRAAAGEAAAAIADLLALPRDADGDGEALRHALELALEHDALPAYAAALDEPLRLARLLSGWWGLAPENLAGLRQVLAGLAAGPAPLQPWATALRARIAHLDGDAAGSLAAALDALARLGNEAPGALVEEAIDDAVAAGREAELRDLLTDEALPGLLAALARADATDRLLALSAGLTDGHAAIAAVRGWRAVALLALGRDDEAMVEALAATADADADGAPTGSAALALGAALAPDAVAFARRVRPQDGLIPLVGAVAERRAAWSALALWCGAGPPDPDGDLELQRLRLRALEGRGNFAAADRQIALLERRCTGWAREAVGRWRVALWDRAGRGAEIFGGVPPTADQVRHAIALRRDAGDAAGAGRVLERHGQLLPVPERTALAGFIALEAGDRERAGTALLAALGQGDPGWELVQAVLRLHRQLERQEEVYALLPSGCFIGVEELIAGCAPPRALAILDTHARHRPADRNAATARARLLIGLGRHDEARAVLAAQLPPRAADPWPVHHQLDAWCRVLAGERLDWRSWRELPDAEPPGDDRAALLRRLADAIEPTGAYQRLARQRVLLRAAIAAGDVATAGALDAADGPALLAAGLGLAADERIDLLLLRGDHAAARRLAVVAAIDGADEDEALHFSPWPLLRVAAARGDAAGMGRWLACYDATPWLRRALWNDRWIATALAGPCAALAARWPRPD